MIGLGNLFLEYVLVGLPVFLAYLFGVILAIAYRRRCPVASRFVLSGACVLLLGFSAWVPGIPFVAYQAVVHWGSEGGHIVSKTTSFVTGVIQAIGLGLLFAAALVGRGGSVCSGEEDPIVASPLE